MRTKSLQLLGPLDYLIVTHTFINMTITAPPELDFDIIFAGGKPKDHRLRLFNNQAELRRALPPDVLLRQTHL